jgi:GTP cyclohydrolase II
VEGMATIDHVLRDAREMLHPCTRTVEVSVGGAPITMTVTRIGMGPLKTNSGNLWEFHFLVDDPWSEYHVLVAAPLSESLDPVLMPEEPLLLRIDSGCVTGQIFSDLTCDCRDQLGVAMDRIQQAKHGIVIAIPRQDGRGMGLAFKLATLYVQQEAKLDTYDAAVVLAGNSGIDVRTYGGAVAILRFFNVSSAHRIRFMTNNPLKLGALAENGYHNVERFPIVIDSTEHTAKHLAAKKEKLGHLL